MPSRRARISFNSIPINNTGKRTKTNYLHIWYLMEKGEATIHSDSLKSEHSHLVILLWDILVGDTTSTRLTPGRTGRFHRFVGVMALPRI